jgi:hypothetical protein
MLILTLHLPLKQNLSLSLKVTQNPLCYMNLFRRFSPVLLYYEFAQECLVIHHLVGGDLSVISSDFKLLDFEILDCSNWFFPGDSNSSNLTVKESVNVISVNISYDYGMLMLLILKELFP